jgi:hypothetical protein
VLVPFLLVATGILLTVLLSLAIGAAARRGDSDWNGVEWLLDLRSPSGHSFFPTPEAARDLYAAIEDVPELRGPDRGL